MALWFRELPGSPDSTTLVFSLPYLDASGAGVVVTISRAIQSTVGGIPVASAVLSGDLKLVALQVWLREAASEASPGVDCGDPSNQTSCFLMGEVCLFDSQLLSCYRLLD